MSRLLLFLLLLLPVFSQGQEPHLILSSLNAYKQTNGVLVRWVIKGGNQCNGTKVFRSANEELFEIINFIPGICGSTTASETYQFFDSVPIPNAYNSYKLELGTQGFSDTITVFFEDFGKANHIIQSDHQNHSYRILFSNDLNSKVVLEVFNRSGNLMHSESGNDTDFIIRPTGWNAGVYLFRISGVAEKDIRGKIYFAGE
ncbi:MAG: hypothetical protein K9G41_12380 [Flavobacteriales bacterium]|nr:hypothetical protein [Flavobacteriales bacterium]